MQEGQKAFTYVDLLWNLEALKILHALATRGVFQFVKRVYIFTESFKSVAMRRYVRDKVVALLRVYVPEDNEV